MMLPLLPDVIYLTINSIGLAAMDATGLKPGGAAQWNQALQDHVARNGKFSKMAVMYLPVQPPPFFWDYNCGRCRFWTEPNGCTLVNGWIARGGWCAVYMPVEGTPPFNYLPEMLQDAPRWVAEFPQAVQNWPDDPLPPQELWMLGGTP